MAQILVVEDDEQMRKMIFQVLVRAGHQVSVAENGADALKRIQPEVELVITDLLMPEKEGLEMILDLRREFPATKIIAISGGTRWQHDFLPAAKKLGASSTLSKPFEIEELMKVVDETLSLNQQNGTA